MSVDQQFNELSEKLLVLLKKFSRLKKENEWLKNELQKSADKENAYRQKMEELHQQITVVKLAAGEFNDKDKKGFEKTINQYIHEIDQCIAFLSQ